MKLRTRIVLQKRIFGSYYILFVIFLFLPMLTMFVLAFQGPKGGVTFPMNGVSLHWWKVLFSEQEIGDLHGALIRSLILGGIVMLITAAFSVMLAMAFRNKFRGENLVFYTVLMGLMVPGLLISLGLSLSMRALGVNPEWYTSALGVHVTWTLPFAFLIMMAVFNRFDNSLEEAARDMGSTEWQTFKKVTFPIILPGIFGAGLFGFTLSYDEFARTILVSGAKNTLPLDIYSTMVVRIKPTLYALGLGSTVLSFTFIAIFLYFSRKSIKRVKS